MNINTVVIFSDDRHVDPKWCFKIPYEEWITQVTVDANKGQFSLRGHIQLFNKQVSNKNPFCVLKFTRNYVKKPNSRKSNSPYFLGKAVCKFAGCTKYLFVIRKPPRQGQRIKVNVEINGSVKHGKDVIHRRKTSGQQRVQMSHVAKEKGPAETFYENLSNANNESLLAGNYNNVPTKCALRKMVKDLVSEELLDRDVYREIDIVSQVTEDCLGDEYVRYLAKKPFGALLYTEAQLEILANRIMEGQGEVNLDATGSIMAKLPEQHGPVFYYAAVVKGIEPSNPPIPVVEFISNRHTVPDIVNFLNRFFYDLKQRTRKSTVPQTIVVDYSWAMIHSVNIAFNCQTTASVLNDCWNNKPPSCLLHICCAHVMHSIARYTKNLQKELKKLLMMCIAKFITSSSFAVLSDLYAAMCSVCLSKTEPSDSTLMKLHSMLDKEHDCSEFIEVPDDETADAGIAVTDLEEEKSETNWINSSPYFRHFVAISQNFENNAATETDNSTALNEKVDNSYYAKNFLDHFCRRYLSILPFWTGIFTDGRRLSNATVENWFRNVKHTILNGKKGIRVGQFIRLMAKSLSGRIREYSLGTSCNQSGTNNSFLKYTCVVEPFFGAYCVCK